MLPSYPLGRKMDEKESLLLVDAYYSTERHDVEELQISDPYCLYWMAFRKNEYQNKKSSLLFL